MQTLNEQVYLVSTNDLPKMHKSIGQRVAFSDVVATGEVEPAIEGVMSTGFIVGGTENVYKVLNYGSRMPWAKINETIVRELVYAIRLHNSRIKLVPASEVTFVYNINICSNDSKVEGKPETIKVKKK